MIYAYVYVEKDESELERNKKGQITERFESKENGKVEVCETLKIGELYELKSGLQVTPEVSEFTNLYKVINSSSQNIFQSGDIVNIAAHNFIEAKKLIKEE